MGMRVSRELERKLEQMCEPIRAEVRRAAPVEEMVEPNAVFALGKADVMLPVVTRSEANESKWFRKMLRKVPVKRVFRECLGKHAMAFSVFARHYHNGGALRIVFTRLGGRKLDKSNLPSTLKTVEDMLAGMLLADDGDSRWQPSWEQEPGKVGVRIEMVMV